MTSDNSIGNDNTIPPGKESDQKQSLNPGDTLGQYKVIRLLGRGGMGEVYEVEHTTLQKRYALKLLPSEVSRKPEMLERFRREARVMANLEHPNIVKVDDFGETDGRCWLRMELASGVRKSEDGDQRPENGAPEGRSQRSPGQSRSAGEALGTEQQDKLRPEGAPQQSANIVYSLAEYAESEGGRLNHDEAQVIFTQILEGLAHAHKKGVIHRDLKPSNILIFSDSDGYATFKIADFGLVAVQPLERDDPHQFRRVLRGAVHGPCVLVPGVTGDTVDKPLRRSGWIGMRQRGCHARHALFAGIMGNQTHVRPPNRPQHEAVGLYRGLLPG